MSKTDLQGGLNIPTGILEQITTTSAITATTIANEMSRSKPKFSCTSISPAKLTGTNIIFILQED